ncbi:MAG: hypothetical protein P4M14_07935 [Gammaproteobacteria bacterium]|nr:hypothetical protein [Gammaproteobacteria bacterium]
MKKIVIATFVMMNMFLPLLAANHMNRSIIKLADTNSDSQFDSDNPGIQPDSSSNPGVLPSPSENRGIEPGPSGNHGIKPKTSGNPGIQPETSGNPGMQPDE